MGHNHEKPYEKSKWYLPNWSWTKTLFCFGERFRLDVLCIANCWMHLNIGSKKWARIVQRRTTNVRCWRRRWHQASQQASKQARKQMSKLVSAEDTCICSVHTSSMQLLVSQMQVFAFFDCIQHCKPFFVVFLIFFLRVFFCYCRALFSMHQCNMLYIVVPSWFQMQSYNRDIVNECLALTELIQSFGKRKVFLSAA